ncbi:MAG: hypothetical protein P9L99_10180 [Candidatus Lernaella stagnicola]|nr:hypothetical protein [Candidatus Lernaella stagnicola]
MAEVQAVEPGRTFFSHLLTPRFFPVTHGIIHAIVDAATVMVIFSTIFVHELHPSDAFTLVLSYDLLAFAGQAFVGYASDRFRAERAVTLAGIVLAFVAVLTMRIHPWAAMIVAGVGNAFFHVGAGAVSLHVRTGRATFPGIFVAPGALGLAMGIYVGKGHFLITWPFLVLLAAGFAFAAVAKLPEIPYTRKTKLLDVKMPLLILFLLLFSVAVRALVGGAGSYDLPKTVKTVSFGLAAAAFAGKAMGGIISDRLGWIPVSVGALLISAPLIAFGGANPIVLTIGLFLFQMTMPVTLTACAAVLPGRPGFAFGLTCLALILGAVPTFYHAVKIHYGPGPFLGLILLSAASVGAGLWMLRGKVPMKFRD